MGKSIILFDGVCNFCSGSVQFIIKRDQDAYFQFASLQSNTGLRLMKEYKIPGNLDSLIVIEENHYYTRSTAALKICRRLTRFWPLLTVFTIVPRIVRDPLYNVLAKNRYRWFGKSDHCFLPSPDIRKRFLD